MRTRNGKIARLPRPLRTQLNQRLEQTEPGPKLLAWLNSLPETRQVLQDYFDGAPITLQNLSEWRKGGYEEWLLRRELLDHARSMNELTEDLQDEESAGVVADDLATVVTIRLGGLVMAWNGDVDEKFEAAARVLTGLSRTAVQLQRATRRARLDSIEIERQTAEREKREETETKTQLLQPLIDSLGFDTLAKTFGGGAIGEKIAKYIQAVQRGNFNAELDVTPEDKFATDQAPPAAPKSPGKDGPAPVKGRSSRRSVSCDEDTSGQIQPNPTDTSASDDRPENPALGDDQP